MAKSERGAKGVPLGEVCLALERIAPLALAQEWDNVGLLAGDANAAVRCVLLCIDLTAAVVNEALADGVDLVMAYHPPIFRPISRLHGHGTGTEAHLFRCVAAGVAVYSVHTALDAADGGTNDVLAGLCGVKKTHPIEYTEAGPQQCKVVVFVPAESADKVAQAMFDAGAGRIGDYEMCSYRLAGEGTFRGSEFTRPTVGAAGQFERVAELRIESVTPRSVVPGVVEAIRKSHPYEEPAFDVYPLSPVPVRGIGRYGQLSRATTLGALARRLKKATAAQCAQIVGDRDQKVTRAIVCVGAAGSRPFGMTGPDGGGLQPTDAIVTGEIRHHDALRIRRHGCGAVALGHWASERPALAPLADRLTALLPTLGVRVSTADEDPFTQV